MFRRIGLAILIAATPLGAHSFAQSPGASNGRQVVVNYSDLDISSRAGAQALIDRMRQAASQVCGQSPDRRSFMYRFYRTCVADALDRGVASLNAPVVAELYRGNRTLLASK